MRCSVWPGWVLIKPDKDLSPVHGSMCCHSVRWRWWCWWWRVAEWAGVEKGGVLLACSSHILLILMCLQADWTRLEELGNEAGSWSECITEQARHFSPSEPVLRFLPHWDALNFHARYPSASYLRRQQSKFIKTVTNIFREAGNANTCGYVGRCINGIKSSRGQWLSHIKMFSGEAPLSSFHLPPSITHHSLSLLLLSLSLSPPHRHFCLCLSPGIPIEDFLKTVARWWPPD